MMDIESFARLEVARGAPVVFHRGTWWRRIKPFYSWPLSLLTPRPREAGGPPLLYGALGYEHAVPDASQANAALPLMLVRDVGSYDLAGLSANTRSHVRRGLKRVGVRKLEEVRDLVAQGVEINRSALLRQRWKSAGAGYLDQRRWRREIERSHALGVRESWGAYVDSRLVAYLRAYVLEDIVCITQAMSHSQYLEYYPNDALLHRFLNDCRERRGVRSVSFGLECAKRSLNEYKMRFGFQVVRIPTYRRLNAVLRSFVHFTRYRHYAEVRA
jgi:hypothetical protein